VSVFVGDSHGELIAAATMDVAAPDTRLNAQRKAYTAARSDATSTRELAEKARADPVERASFDPFFTFFLGGVSVFEAGRRVGAVGVSGLPGDVDDRSPSRSSRTRRRLPSAIRAEREPGRPQDCRTFQYRLDHPAESSPVRPPDAADGWPKSSLAPVSPRRA
jgi:uncharacterized protein GlcG (DUF336 family)